VFGTNEGAILTRNGSLWVEITPGTSGFALVSQGTSAVPAWAAQSGGAGAWSAGTVTAVGHGLEIDSGTIQAQGTLAYNGTNAGTVTITPTAGVSDVIVNAPSAGGTITLAVAPAYAYQEWRTHIKQGATASVVNLNSGYVFAPTGGPTGFTATATANVRDVFWNQSVDGTHAVVGALLQGITI
jgi:hypothetical protein